MKRYLLAGLLATSGSPEFPGATAQAREALEVILGEARLQLSAEEAAARAEGSANWRAWAEQAALRGSGMAHRWSKLPATWRPRGVQSL